jgi:hypothetical protein
MNIVEKTNKQTNTINNNKLFRILGVAGFGRGGAESYKYEKK